MRSIAPFPAIARLWVQTSDREFAWSQQPHCASDLGNIDAQVHACMARCNEEVDEEGSTAVPKKLAATMPTRMTALDGSLVHSVLDLQDDSETPLLFFAAIKFEDATVGLAFSRTYWSFNYVNTAYVALYMSRVVGAGKCSDESDIAFSLRSLTDNISDDLQQLSQDIAQRWPSVRAEPLDLIIAPLRQDKGESTAPVTSRKRSAQAVAPTPPQFELSAVAIQAFESLKSYSSSSGNRLFPIGVVGNLREGKSTLQNMLMQLYDIVDDTRRSDSTRTGHASSAAPASASASREFFKTSADVKSETRGANCYVLPYFRDKTTWMVFVDFEGFGDPQKPVHYCSDYDVRLFAIAIAVLKCMLYNTRSAVDHYVIDRLKALKFVADDSLFSAFTRSSSSRKATATMNRPSVFLVLRDFSLRTVDRSTIDAVAYYKKLLYDEGSESATFLNDRFARLEIHPMPKPIESEAIAYVSQLPLSHLSSAFGTAVKVLARDTGFWTDDSHARVRGDAEEVELDTFQDFTERIKATIAKVNAATSQPLMMTSILAHQAVESQVFAMEARLEAHLKASDLPLTDDALARLFDTSLAAVHKEFTAQVASVSKVSGSEDSLQIVIEGAWGKVKDKAERERRMLVALNDKEANAMACTVRNALVADTPPRELLVHPSGSEGTLLEFMHSAELLLKTHLTQRCPLTIVETHLQAFHADMLRTYENYVALNAERRRAEEQQAEHAATARASAEEIAKLLDAKSSQETKLKRLTALSNDLNLQIADAGRTHAAELVALADKHYRKLEDVRAEAEKGAKQRLADQQRGFEKQIKIVQEKLNEQVRRANGLQRQRDEHRCQRGCLPGNAWVLTQHSGAKQLRELRVGESILVASASSDRHGLRFEQVGGFFDYKLSAVASFVTLSMDTGASVSLTPSHLIWCDVSIDSTSVGSTSANSNSGHRQRQLLQASKVVPGMRLVDVHGAGVRQVVRVKHDVMLTGVYSPFVPSGSFIANGVCVSAYAKPQCLAALAISDAHVHALCHAATAPIRVAAQCAAAHKWMEANRVICRDGTALLKRATPAILCMLALCVALAVESCVHYLARAL